MNWAECNNYNDCQDDKKEIVTYCEIACASPLKCICRQGETGGEIVNYESNTKPALLSNEYKKLREDITRQLWAFAQQFKTPREGWIYNEYDYADRIIGLVKQSKAIQY